MSKVSKISYVSPTKMVIVVTGSRYGFESKQVIDELNFIVDHIGKHNIAEIVVGDAIGVDAYARAFARVNEIELNVFKGDWSLYGLEAGMIRNKSMFDYAVENYNNVFVLAFQANGSKGTQNMINMARGYTGDVNVNCNVYTPNISDKVSFD